MICKGPQRLTCLYRTRACVCVCPCVQKLCLDLTEIGNAGVTEVQRGLMGNTQGVEELSFNRVCLTAAGADDVIYLVRRFATTLQTLNLEGNGLGDKGVMAIATEALKVCTCGCRGMTCVCACVCVEPFRLLL